VSDLLQSRRQYDAERAPEYDDWSNPEVLELNLARVCGNVEYERTTTDGHFPCGGSR
jgi:hypothetical protein